MSVLQAREAGFTNVGIDLIFAVPGQSRETWKETIEKAIENDSPKGLFDDFREALGEADFVTLHMPGQPDGAPVLGRAEFAAMKPGAFLVNTARGTLIDEDALFEALTGGRLRGAGLDVTRQEPPEPGNPLLGLENLVLTPHIGSLTEEGVARMAMESVRNCLDAIDGRLRPAYVVNKEVLGA